jgi:hypothetical protein
MLYRLLIKSEGKWRLSVSIIPHYAAARDEARTMWPGVPFLVLPDR